MTKLCPLSFGPNRIGPQSCTINCSWFSEDVGACAIWKIAEGFAALTALATDIIEKAEKTVQEALEKLEKEETNDKDYVREALEKKEIRETQQNIKEILEKELKKP